VQLAKKCINVSTCYTRFWVGLLLLRYVLLVDATNTNQSSQKHSVSTQVRRHKLGVRQLSKYRRWFVGVVLPSWIVSE
jgi:hypothetical protein